MRVQVNDGQEISYTDLNAINVSAERMLLDRIAYSLVQKATNGFFNDSCVVSYVNATTVQVNNGYGLQLDAAQVAPEPTKRLIRIETALNQTIAAAHASLNRIDIVCIKANRQATTTQTRRFKATTASLPTTQSFTTQTDWVADLLVVTGTASGSPAVPATPTGYIKLAEVLVTAAVGVSGSGSITDKRLVFNSTYAFGAGTVAAPSIYFSADSGSGFYRKALNSVGFVASGVEIGSFSATGLWIFGPTGSSGTHQINGNLQVKAIAASGLVLCDSSGNIISGGNGYVKNPIINSNFDICQRWGTLGSRTIGSAAADYTLDRWYAGPGNGTCIVSQQAFTLGQGVVPNEPTYFMRYNQSVASSSGIPSIEHPIEGVRTYAGKTITISFWAKAASTTVVSVRPFQYFGTGGSPSSSVASSSQNATVTTSWQLFSFTFTLASISGKTLGTNGNDALSLQFLFPLSSTYTVDFSQVMVNEGSFALPWSYNSGGTSLDLQAELAKCQRYFEKSYDYGTAPGTITAIGQKQFYLAAAVGITAPLGNQIEYKIPKRGVGGTGTALTIYSPNSATAGLALRAGSTTFSCSALNASSGQNSFVPYNTTGSSLGAAGDKIELQWAAEFEIYKY